jgi:type IV secretion system protein VirD4
MLLMRAGRWPGGCSLGQLNLMLRQAPDDLEAMLKAMAASDDMGGLLRRYGGEALMTLETAPRQFMGGLGMALQATEIYDENTPLGRSTAKGTFDPKHLKDGKTDLFVILPGRFVETQGNWSNLVISLCMESVGSSENADRVTFFLEEFANLGFMPGVRRAMAQYRAQGLQAVIIAQGLDQLSRLYGPEAIPEFISLVDGVQMFGVRDPQTLRLVSEWTGQYTAKTFSQNLRDETGLYPDVGMGISETGVPLMRKETIRQMSGDGQIIFYKNNPPLWARKVDYRTHPVLGRRAAPNPYYAKRRR